MEQFTKISEITKSEDLVNLQNQIINDNIVYRANWEQECKSVMQSYNGIKFPAIGFNKATGQTVGSIKQQKGKETFVNLIKRQYRVTSNYLLNNKPQYLVTKASNETTEEDLLATREFLDYVFDGRQLGGEDMSFFDTVMDDIIYYGLFRGLTHTLSFFDPDKRIYVIRNYDPMDTYADLNARSLRDGRKLIITYTKGKDQLMSEYPVDAFGKPIEWKNINTDKEKTLDTVKKSMLLDPPKSNTLIVREGFYVEKEGSKDVVYRVITTKTQVLKREKIEKLDFLPIDSFTPINEPENLYPRGWYVDMVAIEREVNDLIQKLNKIIKTGGRFVYVREGVKFHKGTSNILNEIGIEVIEISESQELPQQANLLQISQADLQHLDFLMKQADEEGGMKSDIMGVSSNGEGSSGRAIQALQAGSKNNIGTALNEINKFMNRLVRTLLKLHDIYGSDEPVKVYSEKMGMDVEVKKDMIKRTNIKVSITGSNAFDEITKEMQSMTILDYILKFNPTTKIPPSVITSIMGVSNDIADDIQKALDAEIDPDVQMAEAENKKLMNSVPLNANTSDNHQIHMAMHTELLKNFPPDSDAAKVIIAHVKMHDAFLQTLVQ